MTLMLFTVFTTPKKNSSMPTSVVDVNIARKLPFFAIKLAVIIALPASSTSFPPDNPDPLTLLELDPLELVLLLAAAGTLMPAVKAFELLPNAKETGVEPERIPEATVATHE